MLILQRFKEGEKYFRPDLQIFPLGKLLNSIDKMRSLGFCSDIAFPRAKLLIIKQKLPKWGTLCENTRHPAKSGEARGKFIKLLLGIEKLHGGTVKAFPLGRIFARKANKINGLGRGESEGGLKRLDFILFLLFFNSLAGGKTEGESDLRFFPRAKPMELKGNFF